MIEQFVNRYPLSKTLRFGLIPQGNTEENFKIMQILEKDEALARNYGKAKEIIDRYHKFFINSCLADFHLTDLEKYALLYYEPNKTEEEVTAMDETAKTMRQAISGLFCKENKAIYDRLSKKDLIENFAMYVIETDEERTVLESFRKCTVYFTGFNQNRLNMYTGEGKSTEIAHRLINQNLPKFLDNARVAKTILAALPKNDLDQIDVDFYDIFGINTQNIFEIPFYNQTLTQAGIAVTTRSLADIRVRTAEKLKVTTNISITSSKKQSRSFPNSSRCTSRYSATEKPYPLSRRHSSQTVRCCRRYGISTSRKMLKQINRSGMLSRN